jgi:hypothetical protein
MLIHPIDGFCWLHSWIKSYWAHNWPKFHRNFGLLEWPKSGVYVVTKFCKDGEAKETSQAPQESPWIKEGKGFEKQGLFSIGKNQGFDHFDELSEDSSDAFSELSENEQEHFTEVI